MAGTLALLYGGISYVLFLLAFLYSVAFVGNLGVPKSIDAGPSAAVSEAVIIDMLLLGFFAIQHSGMARGGFKRWWTKFVPWPVERSTYVLMSSLVLLLLFWQWRPLTGAVWNIQNQTTGLILQIVFWLGWCIVLVSTFLINHFNLFGLEQVYARWRNVRVSPPTFRTPLFYKVVRHPIYFGFLLAFWATPVMTFGHLLFAVATTSYVLIGIVLEERDLIGFHGDDYVRYRESVSMIIPMPPRRTPRPESRQPAE